MSKTNPKVDEFLNNAERWGKELKKLRTILLDAGLTEELKWSSPCYSFQKKNIAIIGELKEYCVLSFFKGALLKDPKGILQKPGENTRSAKIIPFTSVSEINKIEPVIKSYIQEAIEVEKSGLKVDFKKDRNPIPEELQKKMDKEPKFKKAFEALTPGRQRGYILHFSAPKQSLTRESRIEKCKEKILKGKGLNDW
ncbi:YdeI/OmpD-associated family protein [Leptospira sarikeiensis]|uniref:YdhG-like domain-containing protein n=1 Tax=Leptospira sarikeiensis TaxID=2484943 RepID=A0A4R9KEW5_9LEPT|nr:DUF1801 domain-containing protein [Leptospira sarikeiensis]TGL63773.1 hypothetical protein EHQ64_04135 [Leptospira sarikeiensis]